MISWLIFAGASVAFWLGAAADARSSIGQLEKTKFFRGRDGRFLLGKYLATMAGIWGAALAVHLIAQVLAITILVSGMLVLGAVVRFRIAAKNRRTQAGL